ncbi:MAG: protein kinase domain-containing protein [Planctomycetota bacterium]
MSGRDGSAAFFEPVRSDDPRSFPTIPGLSPVRMLGRGASATVWRARESAPIAREVAVKVLDAGHGSSEALERFRREWSAIARAAGEGVANLLGAGIAPDGRAYLVMELVEGELLVEACERRSLPLSSRLELVAQLCDIVARIHGAGIVHRDLKPSNIMVSFAVAPPRVTVLDFGVARLSGADHALTEDGSPLGTPEWMAPEQTGLSPAATGPSADLWAIGLLIERLWNGCAPFDRGDGSPESVRALLARVAAGERTAAFPPQPRPDWDDLDASARERLARCMRRLAATDPSARGDGASGLAVELRSIAGSRVKPGIRLGRLRAAVLLAAIAAGAGIVPVWNAVGRARLALLEPIPPAGLRAVAWGVDSDGRCALPSDARFLAIAAGPTFTLAVRADGSVLATGSNAHGALEVPPAIASAPKIPAVEVAARDEGGAALLADGQVLGWGLRNSFGAEGRAGARSIDARRTALIAIMDDRSLAIDGPAPGGMVSSPHGAFTRVRVGHKTAAALDAGGALVAWGSDATGVVTGSRGMRVRDFDFAGRDSRLTSLGVVAADGSVAVLGAEPSGGVPALGGGPAVLIAGAVGAEWFAIAFESGGATTIGAAPPEVEKGARGLRGRAVRLRAGEAHVVALVREP